MNDQVIKKQQPISWNDAQTGKKDAIWRNLQNITVGEAIERWLGTFKKETTLNSYSYGMKKLAELGFIQPDINLQMFSLINHESIIDRIKQTSNTTWKEATRQLRAACYISFTKYLSRETEGMIRRAIPNTERGEKQTFHKVNEKVTTKTLNIVQWTRLFAFLENQRISGPGKRDALIGKLMLQGGKRISEVLSLCIDQIDWEAKIIRYKQLKTTEIIYIPIHYRQETLDDLKLYLNNRKEGLVFITKTGKPVSRHHITRAFARASEELELPFTVTPHVFRASLVTYLKDRGYSNSEIRKITGHASDEMVDMYDKTPREDNPSKQEYLI